MAEYHRCGTTESSFLMRVADYIAHTLAAHGVRHVFMVTGGGAMHLNDAIGRCPELEYICCHHEQACAMAAESYARLSGHMAAVNVTTGPGGINALNGVFGAWTDSIPMIVVSGQVKWETTVRCTPLPLRQLGDQEADIVRMVEGITKYACMVENPEDIRYELEKALFLATHERPGPVWLDVPMNVQGAIVDPGKLRGFDSTALKANSTVVHGQALDAICFEVASRLKMAERPVIIAGSGVRVSGAYEDWLALLDEISVPVTTAWNAHDVIWNEHRLYSGRPGILGERAGNFVVQNSDLLLSLGCRLSIRQVGYDWRNFARGAFRIMVDIDAAELAKPTLSIHLPIQADLKEFIPRLRIALNAMGMARLPSHIHWLDWCKARVRNYPVVLPRHRVGQAINPYQFIETLFENLDEDEVIVCGNGTACVVTFQAAFLKPGQRLFHNSGSASMGYDLPAAIGAYLATGKKIRRIICITGDGSIMMNLQELQTIADLNIPIKIFLLNNAGYHSIRQTQNTYFTDNPVGFDADSGVSFPEFKSIVMAFGLGYQYAAANERSGKESWRKMVNQTLNEPGPQVCEVILDSSQPFEPKVSSKRLPDGRMVSAPLEDMFPFLPRDEFYANMIVKPLDE